MTRWQAGRLPAPGPAIISCQLVGASRITRAAQIPVWHAVPMELTALAPSRARRRSTGDERAQHGARRRRGASRPTSPPRSYRAAGRRAQGQFPGGRGADRVGECTSARGLNTPAVGSRTRGRNEPQLTPNLSPIATTDLKSQPPAIAPGTALPTWRCADNRADDLGLRERLSPQSSSIVEKAAAAEWASSRPRLGFDRPRRLVLHESTRTTSSVSPEERLAAFALISRRVP